MATSTTGDNPNPPKSGRIASAWATYRRDVVPAGAGDVQARECEMAFWAGVVALHALLLKTPDDDAEADAYVQTINEELDAFYEGLDRASGGVLTYGPQKISH